MPPAALVGAGRSSRSTSAGRSRAPTVVVLGCLVAGAMASPAWAGPALTAIPDVAVLVHYRGPDDRPVADAAVHVLAAYDYRAAGERSPAGAPRGAVRYYRRVDRAAALHVRAILEGVLASKGRPARVALDRGRGRRARADPIEVWIPSVPERQRATRKASAHGRKAHGAHPTRTVRRHPAPE